MLISEASAQGLFGGGGGGGGLIEAILPLVLIFAVFYFLLIRPQQKKMKAHREMLGAVRRGDKVLTGGGIFGTVTKVVNDNEVVIQIADAVKVRVARGTISEVLSRTEPAQVEKKDKSSEGAKAN